MTQSLDYERQLGTRLEGVSPGRDVLREPSRLVELEVLACCGVCSPPHGYKGPHPRPIPRLRRRFLLQSKLQ